MKTFLVNADCPKHPLPACWPCSTHAMLNGQDFERERIIELLTAKAKEKAAILAGEGYVSTKDKPFPVLFEVGEIINLINKDDEDEQA